MAPESIIAAIRRGELRAIDVATPGSARPRFKISPDAIREFEAAREVRPRIKPVRRRRSTTVIQFYK